MQKLSASLEVVLRSEMQKLSTSLEVVERAQQTWAPTLLTMLLNFPLLPIGEDEPGQGGWELAARVSWDCWWLGFGY